MTRCGNATQATPLNLWRMRSPTVDSIMLEFRASQMMKRSIKTASKLAGLRLAMSMIDLTTL
jgi:hypothetical protein